MNERTGFDKTTAAIVRLEEKVSRLESDFKEMKAEVKVELSDIKLMLAQITAKMNQDEGAFMASRFWIGIFAGLVSFLISIGTTILIKVFFK
jgi:molybdopterin converting factor small subunit